MLIKNIRDFGAIFTDDGVRVAPGEVVECTEKQAAAHIERGFAEEVKVEKASNKPKPKN